MTILERLDASGNCGINDSGIQLVNLIELCAQDNQNITNVNHRPNYKDWMLVETGHR